MIEITLIATMHGELGNCNSEELLRIINRIEPEVIFEELSNANFVRSYIDAKLSTLETNTIKAYSLGRLIVHLPVDTYELPPRYWDNIIHLGQRVEDVSRTRYEFRHYIDGVKQHLRMVEQSGFAYLNSDECGKAIANFMAVKEHIVNALNDAELIHINSLEKETVERREDVIISNIYSYSETHNYSKAILLIGAAHRASIIRKIDQKESLGNVRLNWRYFEQD